MRELAVARRYARALLVISREQGVIGESCNQLGRVAELFEDPTIARVLTSPATGAHHRRSAVAAIASGLRLSKLVEKFLGLLAEKRRLTALPAINLLFGAMVDQEAGRARARILSAIALNEAAVSEVKEILRRLTGKEVVATVEVAPDLLAGIVVYAQGRVYDGSIRRQLEELKRSMAGE